MLLQHFNATRQQAVQAGMIPSIAVLFFLKQTGVSTEHHIRIRKFDFEFLFKFSNFFFIQLNFFYS